MSMRTRGGPVISNQHEPTSVNDRRLLFLVALLAQVQTSFCLAAGKLDIPIIENMDRKTYPDDLSGIAIYAPSGSGLQEGNLSQEGSSVSLVWLEPSAFMT